MIAEWNRGIVLSFRLRGEVVHAINGGGGGTGRGGCLGRRDVRLIITGGIAWTGGKRCLFSWRAVYQWGTSPSPRLAGDWSGLREFERCIASRSYPSDPGDSIE